MSSARWRSDNPPTVFDWLIRHWLRNRAAFTRPNFGTAIRMSTTFAVETYSGGLSSTCSICTRPSFRSFFSFARFTRMSFARLSASIRWSRERTGAWAWVLGDTIERASLTTRRRGSSQDFRRFVRARECVVRIGNANSRTLLDELRTHAPRCIRICKKHRAERDVRCAGGDELERVAAARDSAHADDRQRGRATAGKHGGERDRLQRRSGEAADGAIEHRPERALVEL